jgi:DNA-binding transcriptional regulator YiaG
MERQEFNSLLEKAGISKHEFANIIGLSYTTVNNWGSGANIPKWAASWFENYIKSKSFDMIAGKVDEVRNLSK